MKSDEYVWNRRWTLPALYVPLPVTVLAVLRTNDWTDRTVISATTVVLVAWHAWWILKHPNWWERASAQMVTYFAGAVLLLAVLVSYDQMHGITVGAYLPTAFVALPGRWSYPAVAILSPLTFGGPRDWPSMLTDGGWTRPVLTALAASGIGAMIRTVEREAARRRETNDALRTAVAENAALQARLVEQARRAGVAAERARIARDIHDTVAQGLTGIVTQLETAEAESTSDHPSARRLGVARDLARESLVEVRRCVEALRPAPLDDAELAEALAGEVATWRRRHETTASFTVTGTPRVLPADVDEAVLRACQEGLSNAARHAAATQLGVTLSYMEDVVVLDIRDDGRGFTVGEHDGFGLKAMRQRADALGGSVQVESLPGNGTAVSLSVPLGGSS